MFLPRESHGQRGLRATVHGVTGVGHDLVTKPPAPPPLYSMLKIECQ